MRGVFQAMRVIIFQESYNMNIIIYKNNAGFAECFCTRDVAHCRTPIIDIARFIRHELYVEDLTRM